MKYSYALVCRSTIAGLLALTFMTKTIVRWTRLSVLSPTHFTACVSDHYWPTSIFTVPCSFLPHGSAGERVKSKTFIFDFHS